MEEHSTHQAVLKTLLVSDLVDSTRLVEQLGDKQAARLFKRHDRLARDLLARFGGREIDKTDGFLLLFERPFEAVRYALAYHQALAELAERAGVELASRVGIHLGEVFLRENQPEDVARGAKPLEVEGLAKPMAARLMSLAAGRQTLLTRGAFDLASRAAVGAKSFGAELGWLAHGAYRFQGVEHPIEVFEVGVEGVAPLVPPRDSAKVRRVADDRRPPAVATGSWLKDRYQLMGELNRGGMGVIHRANDPLLGREVAVKLIPPGTLRPGSEERFRREARVVAGMDHPGIVPIHDFGQDQGSLFLVMPLLEGANLREWIRRESLELGETLEIAAQIAEALDYSHARGIVHRDVKPENVMVSREGDRPRVRVMDFGLALRWDESRLTGSGGFVGTVAYMSPEQVTSAPVDGRTDVYALGTVLYECLAGEPPFSGAVQSLIYRIVHEYPQSLRARGVGVDAELDKIVLGCLAKEPSKRPAGAGELAQSLRGVQSRLRDEDQSTLVAARGRSARITPPRVPLVGRETELAELQARLNAALEGECQLALVEGEAGTGKRKLLAELEKLASARGVRVLRGRLPDHRSSLPYQGFCEVVRDYFRGTDSGVATAEPVDTAAVTVALGGRADLRAQALGAPPGEVDFTDLAPDLVAVFPVLSEIPELRAASSGGGTDRRALEAADRRREATFIYELMARTMARLAAGRPLMMMLENLHATRESLEALEYSVHRLGPTPTLVIGTFRPSQVDRGHPLHRLRESFRDDPRFRRIALGPLSVDALRQLAEVMVGSGEIADDLVTKLHEATEGNLFFGQELIRSLLESKAIRPDDRGAWRLARRGGITAEALPATIRQAVERKIERLDDEHRKMLAAASVLGRSFDYQDLESLLNEPDLEESVDALIDGGILEEDRLSRGDRLIFSSGIVCDVLYQGLPRRKRRALHRRHAERLETRHAGRLDRVYPILMYHFSEGDVAAKTVSYGLAQARRSLDAWSLEDAIQNCKTALEFVDEDGVEHPVAARAELRLILAKARRRAGHLENACREGERAVAAFEEADERDRAAEVALFLAETTWQGREGDATWRWVERGIELARVAASTAVLRKLLTLGATVANLRGAHGKAQSFLDEAERLAPPEPAATEERKVPSGGTLVAALPATIASVDPAAFTSDEEVEVAANVFETLLATSEDGNLVPVLCSEWRGSGDSRSFELTLWPDVRFSDGGPLRAREVKTSLERLARRGAESSRTALSALEGFDEFRAEEAAEIRGIEARGDLVVGFQLTESLPIFPVLLTIPDTAIVKEVDRGGSSPLLGTGPFRLTQPADQALEQLVLERNPNEWRGAPARLDRIEFRMCSDASSIADGLRAGEVDLGRDLLPEDLEEIPRDPRFRSGLVETTKKNTYFVLFNRSGPMARDRTLRQALAGVVRTHDLVWRTLGRFAQPAVSLIPPGVLGHDPGRRRPTLSREEARRLSAELGQAGGIRLRAAIYPLLEDRYGSLTAALLAEWSNVGVEVVNVTPTTEAYVRSLAKNRDIDLFMGRWVADYDDPDGFTYALFQSRNGIFRKYCSSPEVDRLLADARQERNPDERLRLYQQFEGLLERECILVPLFHDVNYRIASPRVRGLRLSNTWPYVNYASVGKVTATATSGMEAMRTQPTRQTEIHVPMQPRIESLDPTAGGMVGDHLEASACVFETLTRVEEGARIVPWLAASFETRDGGRSYRFRLREEVRFHDGRRLSTRDVRYSFERVLRSPSHEIHFALLPIRGARALRGGEADALSGLRILSATELELELERPVVFLPALLSHPVAAIVPEGSETFAASWHAGCSGTGPFRVAKLVPGERLELERNPEYWRRGYPRGDRLVFHFGISPEETFEEFHEGQLTLATELRPVDLEALRRDPKLAGGYRESPRLTTYFLALNNRRQPFSDPGVRRAFAQAIDFDSAMRQTAGRLARPAFGLLPPGLLGYMASAGSARSTDAGCPELRGLELQATYLPPYAGEYAAFLGRLRELWAEAGISVELDLMNVARLIGSASESPDMAVYRWIADYPDADGFVGTLLHSTEGSLGDFSGTPAIDRLIEAGRSESAPSLRHEIYREIEETIAREALLIPLFHDQTYRICQPFIRGLRFVLGGGPGGVWYEELHAGP